MFMAMISVDLIEMGITLMVWTEMGLSLKGIKLFRLLIMSHLVMRVLRQLGKRIDIHHPVKAI